MKLNEIAPVSEGKQSIYDQGKWAGSREHIPFHAPKGGKKVQKGNNAYAGDPREDEYLRGYEDGKKEPVKEGFYDGKFGGGEFGRRSYSDRVRDEARDLGEPAPATNFFGRGSRSAQSRNGSFNIMINGKLWSKDGQPVSFSDMNKASAAADKVKARMAERGQQGEVKVVNGAR